MDRRTIGKEGELLAIKYLKDNGYSIIETNYLKRTGEIDIIAMDPKHNEYVFIEVKTRKNLNFGYPEESVDEEKMDKIAETAETWLNDKNIGDVEWSIDIISIEWKGNKPIIKQFENVS